MQQVPLATCVQTMRTDPVRVSPASPKGTLMLLCEAAASAYVHGVLKLPACNFHNAKNAGLCFYMGRFTERFSHGPCMPTRVSFETKMPQLSKQPGLSQQADALAKCTHVNAKDSEV
jgi:hypothetical protein